MIEDRFVGNDNEALAIIRMITKASVVTNSITNGLTINANPCHDEHSGEFCSTDGGEGESTEETPRGNWKPPVEKPGPNKGSLPEAKPFKDPPLPKGKSGERAAGGFSASGLTNTHIGDLAELVIGKKSEFKSLLPPGHRQNPLDAKYDESDQGFEIKATSTNATEYKSAPKTEEVEAKLTYSEQYGFKPNLIVAVVDTDSKEIHLYMRKGKVVGSLYKGGKINRKDFEYLGTHGFSEKDIEESRPKGKDKKVTTNMEDEFELTNNGWITIRGGIKVLIKPGQTPQQAVSEHFNKHGNPYKNNEEGDSKKEDDKSAPAKPTQSHIDKQWNETKFMSKSKKIPKMTLMDISDITTPDMDKPADEQNVKKIAKSYKEGKTLPPIGVHKDNSLYDGNHRLEGAKKAGFKKIWVLKDE